MIDGKQRNKKNEIQSVDPELQVTITSKDYDRLIQFYCEALGLELSQLWNNGQG